MVDWGPTSHDSVYVSVDISWRREVSCDFQSRQIYYYIDLCTSLAVYFRQPKVTHAVTNNEIEFGNIHRLPQTFTQFAKYKTLPRKWLWMALRWGRFWKLTLYISSQCVFFPPLIFCFPWYWDGFCIEVLEFMSPVAARYVSFSPVLQLNLTVSSARYTGKSI